eukprot:CAMPEP_0113683808 /NCGR_PEP_ID=MMETSP0038_2-20120614/13573_1 /TAXON_ID=2898 /ORGANISM="Cryptomonas paramecium" /LENGTH=71 /DNA_ID=CAMNT_0000603327 /DNA_START=88 /DNA_END=307 /DNA_ORIENTATION=- /assembly_acc=CAM_ASM_000170
MMFTVRSNNQKGKMESGPAPNIKEADMTIRPPAETILRENNNETDPLPNESFKNLPIDPNTSAELAGSEEC